MTARESSSLAEGAAESLEGGRRRRGRGGCDEAVVELTLTSTDITRPQPADLLAVSQLAGCLLLSNVLKVNVTVPFSAYE